MKIRNSFVSNSSSSSFIVRDKERIPEAIRFLKENMVSYYVFKDILYTPYISDQKQNDLELPNYFEEYFAGGHGYPYSEEDFVEVEGEGGESIWIGREGLTDEDLISLGDVPIHLASELYLLLKHYFEGNSEFTSDNIIDECRNYIIFDGDEYEE